jgi:Asp-tRNA(Asn)/Glu-tRNA(Gln) amidotransferase A subunit family amidase
MIELSATEAVRKIRDGEITSAELVQAYLDRIDQVDGEIEAWAHLDRDFALGQAETCDAARASGADIGPLHGLPVGIKDICDTESLPTENGTVLDSGRQPMEDCSLVTQLKAAGAVIMGKTVTTELAVYTPGKTRNPHNPEHTPGGSSSGSAAAVASHMAPLAIGSQTNGSVLRPAAYCGVVGFKPTFGRISRSGVIPQSPSLDQMGVLGRTVADVALIAENLMAFDRRDPGMRPMAVPALSAIAAEEPPMKPILAFVKSPVWDNADDDCKEAYAELAETLGEHCEEVPLPDSFNSVIELHRTVHCAEMAKTYAGYYDRGKDDLSDVLRSMIEEGQKVKALDYLRAIDWQTGLNTGLDHLFDRYDAILTPATTGEAPKGLEATGSPMFCTLWTYCGVPAVTLPLLEGSNGLPMGVQLVGPRGYDARLLRTANWLAGHVSGPEK